jgi:hypothetical protein
MLTLHNQVVFGKFDGDESIFALKTTIHPPKIAIWATIA